MELIRHGSTGPEVEDVQRRLTALGWSVDPDEAGDFAHGTDQATRAFQQARGLPADGIVGPDTWQALVGASYRLGDRMLYVRRPLLHGDDVLDLQRRLSKLGFDVGYDDGIYGVQTFEAVREFQLNTGLDVDGIAGPSTVDAVVRLHRQHQEAPAYVVREREQLRRPQRTTLAGARILVDPAHCVDDPGRTNPDGVPEHEITWAIARALDGRLAAMGAHVVLARGPSTSPTPSQRAQLANDEGVEAIISVHGNGLDDPEARGAAAYYFGSGHDISERGRLLAQRCVDEVVAATGTPNCRTHASTSAILRESRAPAVVIEPGFLTHPVEGRALADPATHRAIATALATALQGYLAGATPLSA